MFSLIFLKMKLIINNNSLIQGFFSFFLGPYPNSIF